MCKVKVQGTNIANDKPTACTLVDHELNYFTANKL